MASARDVPTLHQLCSDLVVDAVINLENVLDVYDFAKTLRVSGLLARVEDFIVFGWQGVCTRHSAEAIAASLGAELHAKLVREQADLDARVRRIKQVGAVVETPPPAQAVAAAAATTAAGPPTPAARASRTWGGGGEKCAVCSKTVYRAERVPGFEAAYHAACLRCATCSAKLTAQSFERDDDGRFYCNAHFQQVRAARLEAAVAARKAADVQACSGPPAPAAPRRSTPFRAPASWEPGGDDSCVRCSKRVYAMERASARSHKGDRQVYHQACFRCLECNTKLTAQNWELDEDDTLLCKGHAEARRRARVSGADGSSSSVAID